MVYELILFKFSLPGRVSFWKYDNEVVFTLLGTIGTLRGRGRRVASQSESCWFQTDTTTLTLPFALFRLLF